MKTFKEIFVEKTLSDSDIKNMISTILKKSSSSDDSSKSINKMAKSMQSTLSKDGGISPEQCGWLMKTMKALGGN